MDPLRKIGGVKVTGRNFRVINPEKILLFWATHRNFDKEIFYQTYTPFPVMELEGLVDNETIFGAFSAARILLKSAPADYDKVYLYHPDPLSLKKRFPENHHTPNLFVLKRDLFLHKYGKTTPPSQTFAALWNLPDWYADDFTKALTEKFYGFL